MMHVQLTPILGYRFFTYLTTAIGPLSGLSPLLIPIGTIIMSINSAIAPTPFMPTRLRAIHVVMHLTGRSYDRFSALLARICLLSLPLQSGIYKSAIEAQVSISTFGHRFIAIFTMRRATNSFVYVSTFSTSFGILVTQFLTTTQAIPYRIWSGFIITFLRTIFSGSIAYKDFTALLAAILFSYPASIKPGIYCRTFCTTFISAIRQSLSAVQAVRVRFFSDVLIAMSGTIFSFSISIEFFSAIRANMLYWQNKNLRVSASGV